MSQASDQMLWCLKKAERELAECQREGKPARHRGLIAGQPNRMLAQGHLRKAEHNLEAMLHNAKGGFTDWAVSVSGAGKSSGDAPSCQAQLTAHS